MNQNTSRITAALAGAGLLAAVTIGSGVGASKGAVLATAEIQNASGGVIGFAKFTEDGSGRVHVNVKVDGLTPGLHGIHIHRVGVCTSVAGEPQVTARVVNTLLAEMDGLEELQAVVVIGATNRPTLVDPALLRPGRFDELVYVGTPDTAGREHILGIHTAKMPLAGDVDLKDIAAQTERFTGADLEDVVRRAGLSAIRRLGRDVAQVSAVDFVEALKDSRATVTQEMEEEYGKMKGELKRRAMEVAPIGFLAPGMVAPTREKKHG